jgi:Kelch motif
MIGAFIYPKKYIHLMRINRISSLAGIILLFLFLVLPSVALSDASTGASIDLSPFPITIADPASSICRGSFYILGGYGNSSAELRNTTFRYNVSSDSWVQLANMTVARWGPSASCSNDRIYVFNGNNGTAVNFVEYYNITLNTWTTVTPEPGGFFQGQGDCSATYNTDSILVMKQNVIKKYTVSTDTWSSPFGTTDDFGTFMTCAIIGDFFYVMGGTTLTGRVNRLDIIGTGWTSSYDTTPYNQYGGLSSVSRNGLIYYGYGFDNVNFFAKMYSYDPVSKIWRHLPDGNHIRDGVGSGILNNTIYIVGGRFHVPAFGLDYVEAYNVTFTQIVNTISAIGWILAIAAIIIFSFGILIKFPLAIFVSGVVVIFLALQLFTETNSVIISSFTWLLAIFVVLIGVREMLKDSD